jgi:peptidoglycan/LPS O-acetylase OafA/YrhL
MTQPAEKGTALPENSRHTNHVRFMDGLRALAVLMVVSTHATAAELLPDKIFLPGLAFSLPDVFMHTGAMGVDIFFFISGFALFYPYAQHLFEGRELQAIRHYVERRFAKIVPSYVLALTVLSIVIPLELAPGDSIFRHFVRHLFFLHAFWPESIISISGPFWSLGVEVEFYVLFPFIAFCLMRMPTATLSALIAISVGFQVALVRQGAVDNFFWSHQLPEFLSLFGFGSFAAYHIVRARNQPPETSPKKAFLWAALAWIAAITLYGIVGEARYCADLLRFLNSVREFTGLALFILSYALSKGLTSLRLICESPVMLWISGISYNLYLWNKNVFAWYNEHLASLFIGLPYGTLLNAFLSLTLVTVIAWAATRWIEKPILREGFAVFSRLRRGDADKSPRVS